MLPTQRPAAPPTARQRLYGDKARARSRWTVETLGVRAGRRLRFARASASKLPHLVVDVTEPIEG
jgi:hypothetical protein